METYIYYCTLDRNGRNPYKSFERYYTLPFLTFNPMLEGEVIYYEYGCGEKLLVDIIKK